MRSSENTADLDRVIAAVQGEIEGVKKNKTVEIDGEKASWKSGYATLAHLDSIARPKLKEHGVAVYQGGDYIPGGGGHVLVTRLAHAGQWIESFFPIKASGENAQKTGGGISFARRWGLCGMLNIIPDDAEEADGYKEARRDARPATRARAPAGLAAQIEVIRKSTDVEQFVAAVVQARAANPTGEAARSVENAIASWLLYAFNVCKALDELAELRDCLAKVKPRGAEVNEAVRRAAVRLGEPS